MKDLDDVLYSLSLLKTLNESKLDYVDDLRESNNIEYDFKRLAYRIFNLELLTSDLLKSLQEDIENIQELKREVN